MTEEEAKVVALKFAIDMCKATRSNTIEECARVADGFAEDASGLTEEQSAAQAISKAIRSLHHSHPGLEREE